MKLDDDLTCSQLVELVTRYLDGALSPVDQMRFEEHMIACDGCANHLAQMRSTIHVLGRLKEADLPAEATDDLLRAFRGWAAAP